VKRRKLYYASFFLGKLRIEEATAYKCSERTWVIEAKVPHTCCFFFIGQTVSVYSIDLVAARSARVAISLLAERVGMKLSRAAQDVSTYTERMDILTEWLREEREASELIQELIDNGT